MCSVSGTTATLLSVGTCTVEATQSGNAAFTAATPVVRSFAVQNSPSAPPGTPPPSPSPSGQVITMPLVPDQWLADGLVVWTATATSGLPVLVESLTPTVCVIEGSRTRLIGTGTCAMRASQSGGVGWSAAAVVDRVFEVRATMLTPVEPTEAAAATGGEGTLTVGVIPASAAWQVTSSAPWLEVSGGGTGPGALTYRAQPNAGSSVRTAVVTIVSGGSVATVTVRQLASRLVLRVTEVEPGGLVTVQWTAEGVAPREYVLEAGLVPGGVDLRQSARTALIFTYVAPPGRHYVRIYGSEDTGRSSPSNEVEVLVAQPRAPSAPVDLVAAAQGPSLTLAWRNTFLGGEPTDTVLHVSGAFALQLPIGRRNQVRFDGVPPGTYTLQVQSVNGHGVSGLSNPVTVRIGETCTAPPAAPDWFGVGVMGSVITVLWDTGPTAAPDYELLVEGIGALRSGGARRMSGAVPPGSYTLSVAGVNACGVGEHSPRRTVVVQ